MNPRVEGSWFIESICEAFSHIALEEMAKRWKSHSRQRFVDYAPNFDSYSQSTIADYLKRFNILSEGEVEGWIKKNRHVIIRQTRGQTDSAESREIQHVCAVPIRRHFKKHPAAWGALVTLGACVKGQNVDFAKWRKLATDEQRPLVDDLASAFDSLLNSDTTSELTWGYAAPRHSQISVSFSRANNSLFPHASDGLQTCAEGCDDFIISMSFRPTIRLQGVIAEEVQNRTLSQESGIFTDRQKPVPRGSC